MLERRTSKEQCLACFSSFSYLYDFCPVCQGTGFVEVQLQRKPPQQEAKINPENYEFCIERL
jgi:rRNA maturation endonuclease Nob1